MLCINPSPFMEEMGEPLVPGVEQGWSERRWQIWGGLGDGRIGWFENRKLPSAALRAEARIARALKGFFCCLLSFSPQILRGQRGFSRQPSRGTGRGEVSSALSLLVPAMSRKSVG